jgi:hypothetical protein
MRRVFRLTLFLLLTTCTFAADIQGLPFQHDDYARAMAEARERNVPIFIEVSAPW